MANYLDTGDTGRAVSAESDGALLAGIFGSAKYVLENGSQLKAEVQSNNIVKISDGDAVMYGRHVRIPANNSALVTINNGHSGTNRIDLIVFRYTKDSTGKETVDLAVIQGEDSTRTATAPATIDGDILTGAMQADFPLYRVELNGLNIVSVTAMFDVIGNISQLTKTNKDLSNKLGNLGQSAAIGQYGSAWNVGTSYQNVGSKLPAVSNDLYETVSGNDAVIKIKKPGTYLLLASSEFGTNAGVGGTVWNAIVLESGTEITRSCAYVYGGSATTVISHMLQVESSITIKLCSARSAGSGTIQNKGKDLLQCIKIL